MRLIRVTDSLGTVYDLDIDDTTAIGIDFQAYDFKEPGKRKINISNSFTVPATIHNLRTFGFPGNVHTRSTRFYGRWYVNYWIDNVQFITDSRIRLDSVDLEANRIALFIFEKPDIWEQFRALLWPAFVAEFLIWMRDEKGLPVSVNPGGSDTVYTGNMAAFLAQYNGNPTGITIPHLFGNLAAYQRRGQNYFVESETSWGAWLGSMSLYYYDVNPEDADEKFYCEGGHVCIYARTIFEFLEYKYGINFFTTGGAFVGNVWDDPVISKVYVPARDICVATTDATTWTFTLRNDRYSGYFEPHHDVEDKPDKSLYDFILSFIQHFNIVIDNEDDVTIVMLRRFDDIEQYGSVVNWSGLAKQPVFKPFIDGYAQNNYIKFASIYPSGNEYANSKLIPCANTGLDPDADLFTIDAYVPAVSKIFFLPVLDVAESFETFQFFMNSATPDFVPIKVSIFNRANTTEYSVNINTYPAVLVSLATEYVTLAAALQYPEFYDVEKWLSLHDMLAFKPFNLYYFQELNGCFYVNKISGFNPDKSKSPTKIELIKINDNAPDPVYNTDFWTDGTGDPYTDGTSDTYI